MGDKQEVGEDMKFTGAISYTILEQAMNQKIMGMAAPSPEVIQKYLRERGSEEEEEDEDDSPPPLEGDDDDDDPSGSPPQGLYADLQNNGSDDYFFQITMAAKLFPH